MNIDKSLVFDIITEIFGINIRKITYYSKQEKDEKGNNMDYDFKYTGCTVIHFSNHIYELQYENDIMTVAVEVVKNYFDGHYFMIGGVARFKITEEIPRPVARIEFKIKDERILRKFYPESRAVCVGHFSTWKVPEKECGIELIYSPDKVPGMPSSMAYDKKYPEFIHPSDHPRWTTPIRYFGMIDALIRKEFPGFGVIAGPGRQKKIDTTLEDYFIDYRWICTDLATQFDRIFQTEEGLLELKGTPIQYDVEQFCKDAMDPNYCPVWFGDSKEAKQARAAYEDEWYAYNEQLAIRRHQSTKEKDLPKKEKAWERYHLAERHYQKLVETYGREFRLHEFDMTKYLNAPDS